MDAIANIMNLFIFVFCILVVTIDKTVVCTSVKSIKSLSLSLSLMPEMLEKFNWKLSNIIKFAFQIFTLKIKSEFSLVPLPSHLSKK